MGRETVFWFWLRRVGIIILLQIILQPIPLFQMTAIRRIGRLRSTEEAVGRKVKTLNYRTAPFDAPFADPFAQKPINSMTAPSHLTRVILLLYYSKSFLKSSCPCSIFSAVNVLSNSSFNSWLPIFDDRRAHA